MITQEQAEQIKKQILSQIESWPEEQKQSAQEQIESMSPEELEKFLIKNKLIKTEQSKAQSSKTQEPEQCVFCSIIKNQIPSYKIDENKSSLAILEINPLSKAHSIIIPKTHLSSGKIPTQAFSLAKKISKKLEKFKPEKVDISTSEFQGHGIINIIPHYKEKELKKYKAEEKELKEVQEKLAKKPKIAKTKQEKQETELKKVEKLPKYPRRVP